MVELVVEYSQGIRRETLELNLYLNDLRVCYVEWLNIFKKKELSAYLIEITQTDICKDKEYCNFLTQVFLKSK